ncbi:ISAs1 family transposase [Parafrankia discariae]|uniref:ISAs1 family transposase n=1 Tax=Parafrankia discariae TaxID=365528 RepID=UPI001E5FCAE7|nr:ISAs1 family transposase [Parafrankia discariae]
MPSSPLAVVVDELAAQIPDRIGKPHLVTEGDQMALLEALAQVPDPRRRRGVRHSFAAILTIAVCAMLSGARSFAAIGEWAVDLPADARAGLGLTGRIPGPVTIWRVLVRVDRAALEAAIGAWIRARLDAVDTAGHQPPRRRRRVLAVDGKAMRATRHGAHPVHLPGVLDHARGVVLAQVDVDEKTNEIPLFSTVLDQIPDLTGVLITVDAMHSQTAHADYLHARGAHLLVTVKRNQPTVHTRLRTLPWKDVPVGHTTTGRGHGRIETRTLKAVTVPAGLGFPHAAQAIQITRTSRPITTNKGKRRRRRETVYAICTLPAHDALPAELATWIRGHCPSRTGCTGSATSPWVKISTRLVPAVDPRSWPLSATW